MDKKSIFFLNVGVFLLIFTSIQSAEAVPEFSFEFGSSGDGDDEFDDPVGIAVSSSDNTIYIADSDNDRISVYDNDGDFLFEFGSEGTGDGELRKPLGVALDSRGNIFVVDSQNDRVQRFDADDGDYEIKFGSSNPEDPDFIGLPFAVAIQEDSRDIFVTSYDEDWVSVFDSSGDFLFKFGSSGSDNGEFRNPSGLVIDDSNDRLYVADTENHRIQIFEIVDVDDDCPSDTDEIEPGNCFVEEFGEFGTGDGEFKFPSGLALDTTDDLLYVADTENHRIQIFEIVDVDDDCPSDTDEIEPGICFVEEFGESGTDEAEFNSPSGLALDTSDNLLYVTDTDNHRIQVFTLSSTIEEDVPERPTKLTASAASPSSIVLTWEAPPTDESIPPVTGYKIEFKTGSDSFSTIVADTKNLNTFFIHEGLKKGETYYYRVSAINSAGTSSPSTQDSAKPDVTRVPGALVATAISPNQIRLSWIPPSETFGQAITGYTIQRVIVEGVYETIAEVNEQPTSYVVGNLATGKTYSYVVKAIFPLGSSDISNSASATPQEDSEDPGVSGITVPTVPRNLVATSVSENEVKLSWSAPSSDGNSPISGYKIESKKGSTSFSVLVENTKSTSRSYSDSGLVKDTEYTYRVSAINSVGVSNPSNEASATPTEAPLEIKPLGRFSIDEGKMLSFTVSVTDSSLDDLKFSLENNPPSGATINANSGRFSWTPTISQGPGSYEFDIVVRKGDKSDRESVTITVNDVPEPKEEPKEEPLQIPAPFVDPDVDPQTYVDRYNTEESYREWFERNYPEYSSIYEAVGLEEPLQIPAPFVDPDVDPQTYVDRYNTEESYREWFERNYPEYSSIYEAVGLEEPKKLAPFVDPTLDPQYYIDRYNTEPEYKEWFDSSFPDMTIYEAVGVEEEEFEKPDMGQCGPGTEFVDGVCELIEKPGEKGGGCLIATATYGSEMAPQVQLLRELRDNSLLQTESGSGFMKGFNLFYYSFSPTIADWERQNPIFKEMVRTTITPLITSLSLLHFADMDSEEEVLGYGISVILLNIGMYLVAPSIAIVKLRNFISQKISNDFKKV